ncbi:unnamed protein product [Rotaria sp. Silwood1]|nr:unnamed protein product [Rotaria sp. Silwood1]CAF1588788.1 unnamed protein product [Rotaria sp. Silwood1]CAF3738640.1 unnamed protein product [Rotaria sp. Silwood1]CAF4963326.1 unnamed protein product [Rotaria sp. Silwood1]
MSENNVKKERSAEFDEDISGTAGLERTVGTTATSTGIAERTGVTVVMPDTGSLDHSHTSQDNQHLQVTSGLSNNTGTISSNQ